MTAKMKMIMHNTKVRLPSAPTVLPIMDISKLSVGHDLANLKTRSWKKIDSRIIAYFLPWLACSLLLGLPGLGQQAVGYWIQLPAILLCTKVGALGLLEFYLLIQKWNLIHQYKTGFTWTLFTNTKLRLLESYLPIQTCIARIFIAKTCELQ